MRIAVDAMGGDYAPSEIVLGVVRAASSLPHITELILVGDEETVARELAAAPATGGRDKISIRHASEVVEMAEAPAQAVRRKKDSSISRAVDLVAAGEADAVVSAGNTGAVVVAATLKLRTLDGVSRPAIAAILPTRRHPVILIDAGANPDCEPKMMSEFALMGSVYARKILLRGRPVVGLLSIGGEESKGNESTKDAFRLLNDAPGVNFRGNIEGHDLFEGEIDVAVCDGFVGNVVLKTSEAASHAISFWMKAEFKRNPIRMLGATLLRGAFRAMKRKMDPEETGGALLLGVNGVCIIAHGSSSSNAIFHSVRVAVEACEYGLNEFIVEEVAKLG